MEAGKRIEQCLGTILAQQATPECPPGLMAAVRHAVFPGGARIRPRLCLAVARACGEDDPAAADAAAAAIELLHCASLVHDDLPCFDDAATAPRPAVGARGLRRAPGGARRRRADRAGLPDPRRPRCATSRRSAAAAAHDHGTRRRHARRHRRRPGLGMRAARRAVATTSAPRPARCSPPPRGRRRRGRRRRRAVARARRVPGRGLPGRRRHPRRRWRPEELGKPTGRDAALGRPSVGHELGLARRDAPLRRAGRRVPSTRFRACAGAAPAARADARRSASAWCPTSSRVARLSRPRGMRPRDRALRMTGASAPSHGAGAIAGVRWRDDLLASPALPALGRALSADPCAIARRRAPALFDLWCRLRLLAGAAGLRAAATCSSSWPPARRRRRELAAQLRSATPAPPTRLLDAAVALRLRRARAAAGATGSATLGAPLVGNPGVAAMIEHHARCTPTCRPASRCCAASARAPRNSRSTGPMPAATAPRALPSRTRRRVLAR